MKFPTWEKVRIAIRNIINQVSKRTGLYEWDKILEDSRSEDYIFKSGVVIHFEMKDEDFGKSNGNLNEAIEEDMMQQRSGPSNCRTYCRAVI